jgi:hypothetical protein
MKRKKRLNNEPVDFLLDAFHILSPLDSSRPQSGYLAVEAIYHIAFIVYLSNHRIEKSAREVRKSQTS